MCKVFLRDLPEFKLLEALHGLTEKGRQKKREEDVAWTEKEAKPTPPTKVGQKEGTS